MKQFDNELFGKLRVEMINDEPYFLANDVTKALGYIRGNDAVTQHVDEHDTVKHRTMIPYGDKGEMRNREVTYITEEAVYDLVMGSKLPEAKQFRKWVMGVVLPTIRKTGGFVSDSQKMVDTYFPNMNEAHKVMVKGLFETIDSNQHKVDYYGKVLDTTNGMLTSVIAKELGMTAHKLNKVLKEKGVQYKAGNQWMLYSAHAGKGYTVTATYTKDEFSSHSTKWTEKGREFIHSLVK